MECRYEGQHNETLEDSTQSLPADLMSVDPSLMASSTQASHVVNNIITPVIFSLGIIGNTVSLAVFGQKRLRHGRDHVEDSATTGLITLAISDLLFCLVGFPTIFLNKYYSGAGQGVMVVIGFYYELYRGALLNVFLFTSTWLIVLISAERFIAVCRPFLARGLIRVYRTVIAHILVFVVSLVVNLPLFFKWRVERLPCDPSCYCYIRMPYWLLQHKTLDFVHLVVWFVLGTFIPFVLLLASNICLLRTIYRSRSHVAGASDNEREQQALSRVTWTLLTIVLCYFLLVCPSMLLQFLRLDELGLQLNTNHETWAVLVTNVLQAIKFSSNFLLYCAIHKRFREALGWRLSCLYKEPAAPEAAKKLIQVPEGDKGDDSKDVAHV